MSTASPAAGIEPGGWVLFNGEARPEGCSRDDVPIVAWNCNQAAEE